MCEFCLKNNWKYGDEFIKKVDYNFKLYLDKYYYDYNFYDNKSNIIKDYSDDEKPDIKLDCSDMIELKNNDFSLLEKEYEKQGYKVQSITQKQNGRMIIGLGDSDVKETTMTFHHTYGIPYIPGQAIKGIVRNYITCEYFNFDEIEALKCENFKRIFGIENEKDSKDLYKGDVIFFDAFPINEKINIKKDIMNVHYKGYYNFKKNNGEINPPSDTETPIPIYFLTVEDATFEFFLAYNEEIEPTINDNNIFELLKEALNKFGIGAKTGVGYGYFEDNEE